MQYPIAITNVEIIHDNIKQRNLIIKDYFNSN